MEKSNIFNNEVYNSFKSRDDNKTYDYSEKDFIDKFINSNIVKLKKEWNQARETWKDSKAKEYEKTFLTPIALKQKSISQSIESLEKISDKLKNLGVDI